MADDALDVPELVRDRAWSTRGRMRKGFRQAPQQGGWVACANLAYLRPEYPVLEAPANIQRITSLAATVLPPRGMPRRT